MPIQILDNFEVNISKPIDNRFVVGSQSFYTNKEQIPYRYPGLRIWDLNDNFPYVWTGLTWSNENQSGVVIGSGTAGFLPKFFGSSPTSNIVNSQIFDNGSSVGIGKTDPASKLDVLGSIRVSGSGNSFVGPGQGITMIDATNISVGNLSLQRITAGNNGDIMVRGSSNAQFVNPSSITVGTASNLTITPVSNNAVYHVPFFLNTTGLPGSRQIFATSSSIQINPSTGNVGIGIDPTTRLHLFGTIRIQNESSNNSVRPNGVRFDTGNTDWYSEIRPVQESSQDKVGLTFWTRTEQSISTSEKVRINPNGRVGIGTTNPQTQLDVNGQIRGSYGTRTSSETNMNLNLFRVVKKTAQNSTQTLTTTVGPSGTTATLIIQTGGTTGNITFGSGFKVVSSLAPASINTIYVIQFVSDGNNYIQSSTLLSMPV
jgi:hypothetical protein